MLKALRLVALLVVVPALISALAFGIYYPNLEANTVSIISVVCVIAGLFRNMYPEQFNDLGSPTAR